MIATARPSVPQDSANGPSWQQAFLALLPQIEQQLRIAFRRLSPEARQDAIQEALVECVRGYERLARRGRQNAATADSLAGFAARRVKCGRTSATRQNVRDPLSRYAQQRKGFKVVSLDAIDEVQGQWREVLLEDRRCGPAEIAASRIDMAAWLKALDRRKRKIALKLATGETTRAVARILGCSAARVSQLRRELESSWSEFQAQARTA